MTIPILDLSLASTPTGRQQLLTQLHDALFNVGFLYVKNHGIPESTISKLTTKLPSLFDLSVKSKFKLSKLNSPHFLGYNGFAEETTLGKKDLREQFDFATELSETWDPRNSEFSKPFWRLRGPNLWPDEREVPGFREAFEAYHDALSELSRRFVHLVEEAFEIPVGTFDDFFQAKSQDTSPNGKKSTHLRPQHRIKLLKYPATDSGGGQGVGPHKDSSGWLTFLYQIGTSPGLEVLSKENVWISAPPIPNTFVVNFGNAFEAATDGTVRATIHRVIAPDDGRDRYSIPFFMGLPLDLRVSEIREMMPESVKALRRREGDDEIYASPFLDERWDCLGESQLRKWIRSHEDVGRKWYGDDIVEYYLS